MFLSQLFEDKNYKLLQQELSSLDVFSRVIKVSKKRAQLLQMFQVLTDKGYRISVQLVVEFTEKSTQRNEAYNIIDIGLRLGGFLSEIGWYNDSAIVLKIVEELCLKSKQNPQTWRKMLQCHHKYVLFSLIF